MRRRMLVLCGFALAVLVGRAQAPSSTAGQQARGRGMPFTEPSPLDFNDHEGYVSIFDGKTLDGWDGNPKFWRVADGAIVGVIDAASGRAATVTSCTAGWMRRTSR